ncbi:hypothetical protein BKA70DRAFT_735489 [Coprinopsis sp. MPI-PUGE-AT-0042]|nr:hypothetical protein BKA70DRAFT_735489 [Coprinopsis sp. MPI-PUGE-AT-0042]
MSRPVSPLQPLPRDLSAQIAASVVTSLREDGQCTRRFRNLTLKNCMLVSQSFAYEFRPYLYETLYIVDSQSIRGQDLACKSLCAHACTMQERPEYQKLVKKLVIALDANCPKKLRLSLARFSEFPSWLEGLSSASYVAFGPLSASGKPRFSDLPHQTMHAIERLCSLPSIRSLSFNNFEDLPSHLISDAPNLVELNVSNYSVIDLVFALSNDFRHWRAKAQGLTTIRLQIELGKRWSGGGLDWEFLDKVLVALPSLRGWI